MDIIERIRRYLENHNKELPWPDGIIDNASERAKYVWNTLTQEERLAISRHNHFRKERNEVLCELKSRGITGAILSELSGLSIQMIKHITVQKRRKK